MTDELAKASNFALSNIDDLARLSKIFSESGYFDDAKTAAQCGIKILAGHELGFPAFASMAGIHIVKGKPAIGANLMAAAVKRSDKYDFRVTEMNDDVCSIVFLEGGQEVGTSTFTKQDAVRAGTQNMGKFPRNMLYARAMSNGVRWFTPDVFLAPVYTPEELGAKVDPDGDVIDVEVTPAPEEPKAEPPKTEPAKNEAKTISKERAEALGKELEKLGYDIKNEAQLLEEAFGLSELEHLTDLTDGEAVILWKRLTKKAAEKTKEAAKEPWERWQSDQDAIAFGSQSGVFTSGPALMTAWEEAKSKTRTLENLYPLWYSEIQDRITADRQSNSN